MMPRWICATCGHDLREHPFGGACRCIVRYFRAYSWVFDSRSRDDGWPCDCTAFVALSAVVRSCKERTLG